MNVRSTFECLPNELYLYIFDYLHPIDIIYSFSNLNQRISVVLKRYSRLTWRKLDLTKINRQIFDFYFLNKQINDEIFSLTLNEQQFQLIRFSPNTSLCQLNLNLNNDYHLYSDQLILFQNLKELTVRLHCLTWTKPFVMCQHLKQVIIHLKSHSDLIELMNYLPTVEKLYATVDYNVSNCDNMSSSKLVSYSKHLIDFSYTIYPGHGLVYFVTNYSVIESLIQKLTNLMQLRLYVIGCLNTTVDANRLQSQLFDYLPNLNHFHFFLQSYGGTPFKTMDEFRLFPWNFASYTNDLCDMHFLFTLPFQFDRLDECLNEYFLTGMKTSYSKSKNSIEYQQLISMERVKHIDVSCNITEKLLILLRDSFKYLESIRFSSSSAEYKCPPSLARQSRYYLHSIRTAIFDQTCRTQSAFIRLLPNLNKIEIDQKLLNEFFEETGSAYVYKVNELNIYSFQQRYIQDIINGFPNISYLRLRTTSTHDEGPVRSFLNNHCHHKHLPVSICDILHDLLKAKLSRLKYIEVGCVFERDEINIQGIISRIIHKHRGDNCRFHIQSEDYKSTQCGLVQILFF